MTKRSNFTSSDAREVTIESATGALKLAVLISGTGRSLQNLIQRIDRAELNAEIQVVISSKASAGGLKFAEAREIPTHTMPRSAFDSPQRTATRSSRSSTGQRDLVVMAGYLQHLLIPADFQWRVINIHPSLIPEFLRQGLLRAARALGRACRRSAHDGLHGALCR